MTVIEAPVKTHRSGSRVFSVTERPRKPQPQRAPIEPEGQRLVVAWGDPGPARQMLETVLEEVLPATGVPFTLVEFDLSIKGRRKDTHAVYKAAKKMQEVGYGVKSATIGPEDKESQGLPNANIELRRKTGAAAIRRSIRPIRGVTAYEGGGFTVVRYADDLAAEKSEGTGDDKTVTRTEVISVRRSRHVANYAFELAERLQNPGLSMEPENVVVLYGSRAANMVKSYSVFDEAVDAASRLHQSVPYEAMPADKLHTTLPHPDSRHIIIPSMEEPGDMLSHIALGLTGVPLGTVPSMTLALDEERPRVVWTDTMHGIGRSMDTEDGRDYVNPMATVLAVADVLYSMHDNPKAQFAGYTMRQAVGTVIAAGVRTPDLGGKATTEEFINALKSEVAI